MGRGRVVSTSGGKSFSQKVTPTDGRTLLCASPFWPVKLSLATFGDLREKKDMSSTIIALFLFVGSFNVVTIATIAYCGFPRPETRFSLVVTLLLVYALLTLAPLVLFPHRLVL